MKKTLLLGLTLLLLLVGCGGGAKGAVKYQTTQDIKDRVAAKETFVLVIGQDTCKACQQFKPTLEEVGKNKKVEISYVEIIRASWGAEKINELSLFLEKELGVVLEYTPTTYFIENGEVTGSLVSALSYKDLVEEMVERGFVKK